MHTCSDGRQQRYRTYERSSAAVSDPTQQDKQSYALLSVSHSPASTSAAPAKSPEILRASGPPRHGGIGARTSQFAAEFLTNDIGCTPECLGRLLDPGSPAPASVILPKLAGPCDDLVSAARGRAIWPAPPGDRC